MPKVGFSVGTGVSSVQWALYNASNVYQAGGTMNNGGSYTWTRDAGWYIKITSVSPYSNYTTPYYYTRTDGYVQNLSSDNVISFSSSVTTKEGTITATYQAPSTYTLTYNLDGGTGDSSNQTKTHGINITLHGAPTKTGYDFQYWQDQTNYSTWAAGANFTENRSTTFKAIWTRKTYTISYDANGGAGAPSAQTKTYGIDLTLSNTEPTRAGYDFLYWLDSITSDIRRPGDTYSENRATTLKAQWRLKTYTISYDANGGAGAPSAQIKYHGQNLTLTTDEPTWSGHIFLYWQDQGTDYHIWYPGDSFDRDRNTTLTALWKTACALFYWHGSASADSSKFASGEPVKDALTAAAWNRAIDKTNEVRELLEQSATTIPKVTTGSQITAVAFNQLRLAIGSTIGAGTVPNAVSKGDTISTSLFIGSGSLREALNEAINNYNNSK